MKMTKMTALLLAAAMALTACGMQFCIFVL